MKFIKSADLPDDISKWEEMHITEDLGSSEEHEDVFYRVGNWGIEKDSDGKFEAYAIVGEVPVKVGEGMPSFEAAVEFLRGAKTQKKLTAQPKKEEPKKEPKEEPKEEARSKPEMITLAELDDDDDDDGKYTVMGSGAADATISKSAPPIKTVNVFKMKATNRRYSFGEPLSFKEMMGEGK